jgi:hypothetical protein
VAVDSAVGVKSKGKTRSQEAISFNPSHEINEDLGKWFEMTVERSKLGNNLTMCQLGLEENHG